MAIKQYSLAKDGARQLAPGFKVREFRCRDGSDVVMIDESLVMLLQCIREHFGKPITITSGYTVEIWLTGYHYPTLADLLTQVTAVESSVTDLQVALCELYEEKEEN